MDRSKCRSASMISRTVNGLVKGKLHLVRGNQWTRLRFQSLMDHEIGTHFLRAHNNQKIVNMIGKWTKEVRSPIIELITEEGLASVNTLLKSRNKLLWSPALSYYSQCRAREVGFTALFFELRQYVSSPEARWSYCLRCKRGLKNTALPGSLGKDRAYLEGAVKILQRLNELDFVLLHSMKVSLEDYSDAKILLLRNTSLARQLQIPSFIKNMSEYKEKLKEIAKVNMIEIKEKRRARRSLDVKQVQSTVEHERVQNGIQTCPNSVLAKPEMVEKCLENVSSLARRHADILLNSAKQNRKKTRQAVISRLHDQSAKREENRNAILDECFKQRSRWGGLAFSWDKQKLNKVLNSKKT